MARTKQDMRKIRSAALLATFDDETRESIIAATYRGMEILKEAFPELSAEQQALVSEAIGDAIAQIGSIPVYALSESIQHSASVYMLGASHLSGAMTLPEAKPEAHQHVHHPADTTPDLPAISLDDDDKPWPGQYL